MPNTKLTEEEIQNMISDYVDNNLGIYALCEKYKVGKIKIKSIFSERNIPLKTVGRQTKNFGNKERKFPDAPVGFHYEAIAKDGSFVSPDYLNKSGALSNHIKKEYCVDAPSSHFRAVYEREHGTFWYEQWFDIKLVEDKAMETKKCPYCDWVTKDIKNKSGAFEVHLKNTHNMSKLEYLKEHPEDRPYFALVNKTLERQMSTDEDDFVTCKICGKKLRRIDYKHLTKHGITKEEYIEKYGNGIVAKALHDRLSVITTKMNIEHPFRYKTSKGEREVDEYIQSLGFETKSDRTILKGKEIDVFVPAMNFGVEYDGLFYHTEGGGKDIHYHLGKTMGCEEQGVELIHILEDEWELKKDMMKAIIRWKLGILDDFITMNDNLPYEIKKVPQNEAIEFNSKYGLELWNDDYFLCIGYYYDGKLIAMMNFIDEPQYKRLTMAEFVRDWNYYWVGIAKKMIDWLMDSPYIDGIEKLRILVNRKIDPIRRKNQMLYSHRFEDELGFKWIGQRAPKCTYYVNEYGRYIREANSIRFARKIWNCGYLVYETKIKKEVEKSGGVYAYKQTTRNNV